MACITRNFTFCEKSGECLEANETCTDYSTAFTNTTGCPISTSCADFGLNGVGYLGDTKVKGGFGVNDSSGIKAPVGNPCAIALFNNKNLDLDISFTGLGVRSYVTKLTFPFEQSALEQVVGDLRILPSDDVVLLYVGSNTGSD